MAKPIYVLNGPTLNMLGTREPEIYGTQTLADVEAMTAERATALGHSIDFRQSNSEGQLVDWILEARDKACGIVLNGAAYTHTSVAIMDAIIASELPLVEVHISNIFKREEFRHHSYVSPVSLGFICGLGPIGYVLAVEALADHLKK
ncbi:type II 3-dehydroquinate dehydratase [Parvibaculaceae bacterium PLY_AMNH_Bact1]|nr:type II 3-dehydroquinate dehydratase [Parvibaculaceae bacterium PLY_AMNH_Bact1]